MAMLLEIDIGYRIKSRTGVYYRNLQLLGSGANSVVYLVLALNKCFRGVLFALRIFTRLSDKDRLDRFQQETDFLRNCDHPSIMRVYDNGVYTIESGNQTKNYPFVVAEYLPLTIHDQLRQRMTTAERISYTLQLLSALSYLDEQNPSVIHRDIKPKNIFIKGKSCVLGDFGLMKFIDTDEELDLKIYKESVGPGMPFFYRTPDLVEYAKNNANLSTKSDVFQLGLVTAEMFTGRNPEKKANDILDPIELEPIGEIPGDQEVIIREFIETMLDFNPKNRPPATDLIDQWEGVFREVVQKCHRLEGRVF